MSHTCNMKHVLTSMLEPLLHFWMKPTKFYISNIFWAEYVKMRTKYNTPAPNIKKKSTLLARPDRLLPLGMYHLNTKFDIPFIEVLSFD